MSEQVSWSLTSFVRQHLVTGATLAAAAFVGYCIYFDHKRRSAPDYKQKIRENRRAATKKKGSRGTGTAKTLPNLRNPTEMQAFFLQEVQLGEELMSTGNLEEGTEHICNAITLCGQPQQLLQIFQQTLPPEHFALIIQKLPEAKERFAKMMAESEAGYGDHDPDDVIVSASAATGLVDDEDLE